ncbi:fatty acid synthase-like [Planococcus citri]|uniref:fatty acid synthase-like n=1 Tax=Planococcus citri TaxID=170843 RepID=UPI0031F8E5A9
MATRRDDVYNSDDIVISGISGVFPDSENVQELKENLLSGKDMVSVVHRYGASVAMGSVKTIDRFDHTFFHVTHRQAEGMTVASRILLEKTFEAILDAGYNPQQIKGKNIAVICGIWDGSDEGDPARETKIGDHDVAVQRGQFTAANRISNYLDLHGPSCGVNTACSSSGYALDMAIKYIQCGQCDAAIVCAPNFSFSTKDHMKNTVLLSSTGQSTPFDITADGYVRSEAVVSIFLQKRTHAKRIYANIIHSTTNCDGFKMEGFTYPSITQQKQLYEQFYKKIDVNPQSISYLEAHGTGTPVGDLVEGTSIEEFFCKGRKTPLKIGSVKSNIGHTEAAAALCGIIKLIISFESGLIPPNLHFNNPNPDIKGLHNGKLEVITKPTPLEGEYFALNTFGAGGANGHVLLTPHRKIKKSRASKSETIPIIVAVSGRTEEAVDCILNDIEKNYEDEEYVALLHEIFSDDISGHLQRGYIILHKDSPHTKSKALFSGDKRPVWFVFSGMGSQWPAMGKSLMNLPIFAESIRKCYEILRTKGIDVIKIITEDDPEIFDNILNSFLGIAAIQIALFDTLKAIGIEPDGIIGHSVGELGCGYADNCFTTEQVMLAAYYRGLVSMETELVHGTMAAVGEGYETMKDLVPAGIEIACHNSPNSCTISGPTSMMETFIEQLTEKKIFVRKVNTANIAYHSRFIAPLGPKFVSHLKKIIPEPKLRSEKWICTSAPEQEWNMKRVKYSSAEYHAHNLQNAVLFEEGCRHIPSNAITIEIAPHGILNTILERSLPKTVSNISLTMKNHKNEVEFFFNSFGKLYEAGCVPKLSALYPTVEFPVSRSTPMISPLIKWQHDEQWSVGRLTDEELITERNFIIRSSNDEYEFIKDHVIDGRNLYPGLGYLWLVLETFSTIHGKKPTKIPVIFENVRFERATNVPEKDVLKFHVTIQISSKSFEVSESGAAVASGTIRILENTDKKLENTALTNDKVMLSDSGCINFLSTSDFYKELRLRGYQYRGVFKKVFRAKSDGTYGEVQWHYNYVSFMDTMAQLQLLSIDTRELLVPTFIQKIVIDFEKHFEILQSLDETNRTLPVHFHPIHRLISSGGIQMWDFRCSTISRQRSLAEPVLEKYQFIPYTSEEEMDQKEGVRLCVNIILQNTMEFQIKMYELLDPDYTTEDMISPAIKDALSDKPFIQGNINILIPNSEQATAIQMPHEVAISNEKLPSDKSVTLIALSNIQRKHDELENIRNSLKDNGFLITIETTGKNFNIYETLGFNVCFSRKINATKHILLLNKLKENKPTFKGIKVHSDSFAWVSNIRNKLKTIDSNRNEKLVIYGEKDPENGIIGFSNCIRREDVGKDLRFVFIMDPKAANFSLENTFYRSQLDKNLSHNVYKDGHWGCYCHLKTEPVQEIDAAHAFCTLEERGNFSSFKWVEGSLNPQTYQNSNANLAYVYYSSLNFRDIMLASGKMSTMDASIHDRLSECYTGIEFSGRDETGLRIMGVVSKEAIATMVETTPNMTWKVPDHISLEEAATIPVVYLTVVYALFFKINFKPGSSVLIHAGSGGIGQAAINICLHYNCTIFTTVGTSEKVQFIRKTFPQIPESHIGNSRNTSFLKLIMEQTNGRGVDVVLNSLSEEKLQASIKCLADSGDFLEIGKFDMIKNNSLELRHFLKNICFYSVQLDLIMRTDIKLLSELGDRMQNMINQGIIKPIKRIVFQANEVESAFRYMAAGKHMGKVLIKIRNEENNLKARPTLKYMKVKPRVLCTESSSYIIVGGLGGFGLELADWLVVRGARNIVLSSRTGIKNGYQSYRIKQWQSYGVNVRIFTEDVTKESGVRNLLQTAISLGPVDGIFNLAVILKDDEFAKQTEEHFIISNEPKAIATKHLDVLSRKMCPDLKHFVVFSSAVCGQGNQCQTNYGYANSAMERICERRFADKLPALTVQWGAIDDVGIVADLAEQNIPFAIIGTLKQKLKSCLEILNLFMKEASSPIVSSIVVAEKRYLDSNIVNTVANILGIKDLKTINQSWTLPELGMDSIIAIELKQILESEFNLIFSTKDLQNMTFVKLNQMKEEKEHRPKSDAKVKSHIQIFMDEMLSNKWIRRIPFETNDKENVILFNEKPTVFMLPGLEGLAMTMEPLAKKLPGQKLCFQYYFGEVAGFSYAKLPDYFADYILKNFKHDREFYLIGHSLGGLIALEVANILEKRGKLGYLCLMECSPSYYKQKQSGRESLSNEEQMQNRACVNVMRTLLPIKATKENIELINNQRDWQSKKKLCFSLLASVLNNDKNILGQLLDRIYGQIKALLDYDPPQVLLESSCELIRSIEDPIDSDEAYSLSQYFKNPIKINKVDADHVSILRHPDTSKIIMECPIWKE